MPEEVPENDPSLTDQDIPEAFPVLPNDWMLLKDPSPFLGQLVYTIVPMIVGSVHGVKMFYFRKIEYMDDNSALTPLNFRKWASLI